MELIPSKILLIDDEADFREIFSVKFSSSGFQVETAGDGLEGIKKAKEWKPDLIVMDMAMPKMNGAQAILKLKEDPETKNIKVIFLTNFGDPHSKEADEVFSRQLGAVGYLRKIDDFDELVKRVKTFLH